MANTTYTNADLYQLAGEDAGKSTAKELAKSVGMKEPNFLAAISKYAIESRKPMPKISFEKSKTTVKTVRRRRTDCDIRISHFRLEHSGMGDVTAFKLIAEPDHNPPRLILVEDTSAPKMMRPARKSIAKLIEQERAEIDEQVARVAHPRGRSKAEPHFEEVAVKPTRTYNKRTLVSK